MAKTEKAADPAKPAGTKPITDVAHPGTTAPSDTSKPIINQRPIMKDPMMVEDAEKSEDKKPLPAKSAETKIAPPEEPEKPEASTEPEEAAEPETTADDESADKDEKTEDDKEKKPAKSGPDTQAAAESAQDAKLQQLIDSKKYFLPINTVEHRRSKRVVIIGVVLALILVVAWVDIALDASLIHTDSVKPVTHFFSN